MNVKKEEVIGIIFLIMLIASLCFISQDENKLLKKEGVFVLGVLKSINKGGDIGWVYSYQFNYNGNSYIRNFSGPVSEQIRNDSLMFFNILPNNPTVCRQLQYQRVPSCLTLNNVPKEGWKILPLSYCIND